MFRIVLFSVVAIAGVGLICPGEARATDTAAKSAQDWQILAAGNGMQVKTGMDISLFNQRENDFIIYAERPVGINIRWFKDRDKAGSAWDMVKGAARDLAVWGFQELATRLLSGDSQTDQGQMDPSDPAS